MGNCTSQDPAKMSKTMMNNSMKKTFNGTFKDTLKNMKIDTSQEAVEIPDVKGEVTLDFVKTLKCAQVLIPENESLHAQPEVRIDSNSATTNLGPQTSEDQLFATGNIQNYLMNSTMKLDTIKKDDATTIRIITKEQQAEQFEFIAEEGVVQVQFKLQEQSQMLRVKVDCTFLDVHADVFYKPMSLQNLMDENMADWGDVRLEMDLRFEDFTFKQGFLVFEGDQMNENQMDVEWQVNINGNIKTLTEIMLDVDLDLKSDDLIIVYSEPIV